MGDIQGLIESVHDAQQRSSQNPEEMLKKLEKGTFSIRDMSEQLKMIMGMGPLSKMMSLIPGMPSDLLGGGGDEDGSKKMRKCLTIFDSMTKNELDSDGKCFVVNKAHQQASATAVSRIKRIAKGSGNAPSEVEEALAMYRKFAVAIKKMGPLMTGRKGAAAMGNNPMNNPGMLQRLQSMMPGGMQEMMQAMQGQMGGMGGGQSGMPQLPKKGFRQTRRK
jgi:signal recognition particle subunit SRP54